MSPYLFTFVLPTSEGHGYCNSFLKGNLLFPRGIGSGSLVVNDHDGLTCRKTCAPTSCYPFGKLSGVFHGNMENK